jgi:5-aminopentanamidase
MGLDARQLRVAAFQRRPCFDDIARTVEQLLFDLKWCDDHKVQLALFPECYLQGYASDKQTIARRALSLDSESFKELLTSLTSFSSTIVLGVIEQRDMDFYNSGVVIKKGVLIGVYSKVHTNEQGFKAGTEYPVFQVSGWNFGINICNDANFPDAALRISQQRARLLCFPLNNMLLPDAASKWRTRSIANLQQRAVETGCWVLSSDVVGEHGEKVSYGCTCIVQPDGQVVKRVAEGIEGSILFDIDDTTLALLPAEN